MAEDDKKTAGRKGARAPVIDLKAEQVDDADKAKKSGKKTTTAKTAPPPGKAKKAPPKPASKARKTDAAKSAEEDREKPPRQPQERKKKNKSRKGLLAGLVLLLALLAAGVWFTPLKRYLPWPPFAASGGAKTAATDQPLPPAASEQAAQRPPAATPEAPSADAAPTPGRDEPAKAGQEEPQKSQSAATRSQDTTAPSGTAAPAGQERGPDPAIQRELATLKERLRVQQTKLAALAALQKDIAALKKKTAAIDGLRDDIGELKKRLAVLDANLQALKAAPATPPIGAAYAALRARVAAGQPYADQLTRLTTLLPAAEGLDALRRNADNGVPTRAMLKTRLDALIAARAKPRQEAASRPAEGGLLDKLTGKFARLVKVRRIDQPDWPAALQQARSALDAGDVTAAIAALRKQPGQPPADIAAWVADATAHVEARAALTRLSDAVIAAMGRGG